MLLAAAALALAACSTPQSRVKKHQALFDAYPQEVRDKILAGEVEVGFTPEQVQLALGSPARVYSRKTPQGSQEVWSYGGNGGGPTVGFGFGVFGGGPVSYGVGIGSGGDWYPDESERVVFENGRVVTVEQRQK